MIKFLDLTAQYHSIKEPMDAAILEVIENAAFIGGEKVKAFEAAFADYCESKYCIGVGNGTDAIEIALEAADLPPGSEVIVPGNTFIACAEAVTRADAIDWVDVNNAAGPAQAAPGLSRCDAMARFHVMDASGALFSGGEAFARLWEALPAFRLAGKAARVPPIQWALNRAYDGFLPFRPHLQRLTAGRKGNASATPVK